MSLEMGHRVRLQFTIPQTELLAGTAIELVAPTAGFVNEVGVIVQTAVTTGGTVTAKVGTTTVAGISVVVANGATKGSVPAASTATAGDLTRVVSKGQRIQVVPASFATAGALAGYVEISTGY